MPRVRLGVVCGSTVGPVLGDNAGLATYILDPVAVRHAKRLTTRAHAEVEEAGSPRVTAGYPG